MSYPNIRYRVSHYPNIHYTPSMVSLPTGDPCQSVRPQDFPFISWFGIPMPDYSFAVEPETRERKLDDVMNRLRQGVESIQNSDVFRQFLMTMAKFHDYSIGNQILIMLQRPAATQVAGFNTWRDLSRSVKAGEKGIMILAPCFAPGGESRWIRHDTEWAIRRVGERYGVYLVRSGGADVVPPTLLQPLYDTRGQAERYLHTQGAMKGEERVLAPTYFKVVYVFDVSQTQGKELPRVEVPTLSGEVNEDLFNRAMALAKKNNLTVEFNPRPELSPDIKGMLSGTLIWVKGDEPRAQQLKTLLHELAHYYTERVLGIPRADAETIAESSAFVVGSHFGFDTGTRSFPYVALWSKDKSVLEKNLAAIRGVSTRMIAGIEGVEGGASLLVERESPQSTLITKAQLTEMFKDERTCGICYDPEGAAHLPSGLEMGQCTNCAWYVVERLGRGQVYGFSVEDIPGYSYRPISIVGGHDFAVIDDRYIVDLWLSLYAGEEKQIVFDMQDPIDQDKIKRIYSDRKHWKILPSYLKETTSIEDEGKAIAKAIGVDYTGPQYDKGVFKFHLLTDPVTGTSFGVYSLEDARKQLNKVRASYSTVRIVPYTPKEPLPPNVKAYLIQVITPTGEIAGWLGYDEHPDYVRIGYIKVEDKHQGKGYAGDMVKKLVEAAGNKPILTGSLNHSSWRLLKLAQEKGKIKITEPQSEFQDKTYFQLEPVR
ncbi:MAG: ArdC-like ssDNA-binding domain-containing protein [Dehalococcoidales bacterium]|nr:ArdC-like ssDNA-binding domain-containing protein [Dehalococcoidales bacterium]